jgi:hypothetical protein
MKYSTASQTEIFLIATQLHDELQQLLSKASDYYIDGFNSAFREANKKPNPPEACPDEDQNRQEEFMKGFTFGVALRAIIRRKNIGIVDEDE